MIPNAYLPRPISEDPWVCRVDAHPVWDSIFSISSSRGKDALEIAEAFAEVRYLRPTPRARMARCAPQRHSIWTSPRGNRRERVCSSRLATIAKRVSSCVSDCSKPKRISGASESGICLGGLPAQAVIVMRVHGGFQNECRSSTRTRHSRFSAPTRRGGGEMSENRMHTNDG
jgi:hypothetical protein